MSKKISNRAFYIFEDVARYLTSQDVLILALIGFTPALVLQRDPCTFPSRTGPRTMALSNW